MMVIPSFSICTVEITGEGSRGIYKHLSKELGEAMSESTVWMDESLARSDFKEGVASFVDRRPPKFQRIEVAD